MRTNTIAVSDIDMAEALFVSTVQPSDAPDLAAVRQAIRFALTRNRQCGCAALVAQEYGEHPVEAVRRMRWVLSMLERDSHATSEGE